MKKFPAVVCAALPAVLGVPAVLAALPADQATQETQATRPAAAAANYRVDPVHTSVLFRVKHLDVAWFYGRFNAPSGSFHFDPQEPGRSSIQVEIKADSVDTANADRDAHLRSPDFFNAKEFPTITFQSREVKKAGEGVYRVAGDLKLHGVTKPLEVEVRSTGEGKDPWGGHRAGFETRFTLKRSDFGMAFMLEGLGDEVHVIFSLQGVRREG